MDLGMLAASICGTLPAVEQAHGDHKGCVGCLVVLSMFLCTDCYQLWSRPATCLV